MTSEEFIEGMSKFLEDYKTLKDKLSYAQNHIIEQIDSFTPKQLECMAMDGIITYCQIPENKRTEFVESQMKKIYYEEET